MTLLEKTCVLCSRRDSTFLTKSFVTGDAHAFDIMLRTDRTRRQQGAGSTQVQEKLWPAGAPRGHRWLLNAGWVRAQ